MSLGSSFAFGTFLSRRPCCYHSLEAAVAEADEDEAVFLLSVSAFDSAVVVAFAFPFLPLFSFTGGAERAIRGT